MLGEGVREIASGSDAAGVSIEVGFGKVAAWMVKARIECWPLKN